MRIFSYGGGVQSTAILVLASQGKVQYDHFLFANVGEDSEHPDTLKYFYDVALPFADKHGISLIEITGGRNGKENSIYQLIFENKRMVPIPVFGSIAGRPMPRRCTEDFKIVAIARWEKAQGATEATNGLGISTDEIHRAKSKEPRKIAGVIQTVEYPLIDLRLSRNDCHQIIVDAGLPIPSPSSCYFCPFHSPAVWLRMKQNEPELFDKAIKLEMEIQRQARIKDREGTYYLHSSCKPLNIAVGDQSNFFDDMDNCESGYCFT